MADYQKAVIYKWACDDFDEVYVGSTTNFTRRKHAHKTACNSENDKKHHLKIYQTMREYGGFENWRMIQIETYPCQSKRELEAREEHWRKELNAILNGKRAFRTIQEKKEYDQERHKLYYETNKESIAVKYKQYREENKDQIKARQQEYYLKPENKLRKAETDKTYREAHKDEIKEKRKDYFDEYNNKEEVKDKKHEWYLANKERSYTSCKERRQIKTECDICGVLYTACRKSEHIKTEKHVWSVENNQKYCNHVPFRTREVTCECGSVCFGKNLADHLKSRKHQNYINSQNKKQ